MNPQSASPNPPDPDVDPARLHGLLWSKVAQLWLSWKVYLAMYGKEENVERMNAISPSVFTIVQEAMIHDLIRMVYALADVPGGGKRKNLSLRRLVEAVGVAAPTAQVALSSKLDDLAKRADALKLHRNRRLMHFDLETAENKSANLPPLLFGDLQKSLDLVGEIMSDSSVALGRGVIAYDFTDTGNADGTFYWLLSDWERFRMLRKLAQDPAVSDSTLREMTKHRSDRRDPKDPAFPPGEWGLP